MQRDFLLPGGFGEAVGRDPGLLTPAIEPTRRVLDAARSRDLFVVHTREGHRPDLSDLLPAKRDRGRPGSGIGDRSPLGRMLVHGEHGHGIVDELSPIDGEPVVDKPGKGAFHATALDTILRGRDLAHLIVAGVTTDVCVATTVREAVNHKSSRR